MIMQIDNIELIESIKKLLSKERIDFWDELSIAEKEEIEKGIQQLDNNERIPFDEYIQNLS
jgi:hypothetical protein